MPNDYFRFRQFTVRQGFCAMKVGTDGTLLGAWASVPAASLRPRILDIGTGTGLIALMMAQRFGRAQVVAVDIDEGTVRQARENVSTSPFADRITVCEGDVRKVGLDDGPAVGWRHAFDAVVCNPPFFTDSLECPDLQRTLARHAATLSYRELMACAGSFLTDDGELSVVVPFDCKGRMEQEAVLAGLFKTRECAVRTTVRKPPRRFLLAFRKHSAVLEKSEMVIGSEEYNEMVKDFYL